MSAPVISLRHHVVSIAAIFLALAVGIALGAGPLGGTVTGDARSAGSGTSNGSSTPTVTPSAPTADPDLDGAEGAPAAPDPGPGTYADEFAVANARRLYRRGLDGHAVALLALPGTDDAQLEGLSGEVLAADGAITGTYTLGESVLDPATEADVDAAGSALATELADPRVDPDAGAYERLGRLVAMAMATDQVSSVRADAAAVTVRETLAPADLLDSPADVRMAPLVLVVLPPGGAGSGSVAGDELGSVLDGLATGMAGYATGVVVTGDEQSATSGDLRALREVASEAAYSTVDGAETGIGRVTAVLTLIGAVAGAVGSYGVSGADGAAPVL